MSACNCWEAPIHPDFLVAKPPASEVEPLAKKQKPNRGMNKNKEIFEGALTGIDMP